MTANEIYKGCKIIKQDIFFINIFQHHDYRKEYELLNVIIKNEDDEVAHDLISYITTSFEYALNFSKNDFATTFQYKKFVYFFLRRALDQSLLNFLFKFGSNIKLIN